MGYVKSIAKSNTFKINNIDSWKEGLKDYISGEAERPIEYQYNDVKRRSRNAEIYFISESFELILYKLIKKQDEDGILKVHIDYEDELNLVTFIQNHLLDNEECIIYQTEYEHIADMEIYVHKITKNNFETIVVTK